VQFFNHDYVDRSRNIYETSLYGWGTRTSIYVAYLSIPTNKSFAIANG